MITFTSANFVGDITTSNNYDGGFTNETKVAAEKYFKNLLKKVAHGESVEDGSFKIIQTESELRAAYCNLYNKINDTDGYLDKRDKRLISEMRKLNMKLMKIEDKLNEMEKSMIFFVSTEMKAIKDDLLRNIRNASENVKNN